MTYLSGKHLLMLTGLLLLSGCTSVMQKDKFGGFEQAITHGANLDAIVLAEERAKIDKDTGYAKNLLWSLQAATLLRQEKAYRKSNLLFDAAEYEMQGEDTEHFLSKGAQLAGSMFLNDSVTSYKQSQFDGVMANTYKALNFMAQGDNANARIEWNRTEDRQRRAAEYFQKKVAKQKEKLAEEQAQLDQENIDRSLEKATPILANQGVDLSQWSAYDGYINPFSTYLHGLYFMLKAQDNSDYSKARDSFKRVYGLTKNADVKVDMNMATSLTKGRGMKRHKPTVWVIFENGLGAKKEEFRIDLPLFAFTSNVTYSGIALPKLVERPQAYPYLEIGKIKTRPLASMDKVIQAEFKSEFPYILTREVIRTTLKTVAQKQIQDRNPLAGMLAGMAQAASTGADIRSWTALPKEWQLARVARPTSNKLTIKTPGLALPLDVDLDPNSRFHMVYVKAAAPNLQPTVETINL
ncbi:COG3014 family protein [Oceanisphaera pacifica]|uniref:Lipoprotein n=1 Tax=Oceanisphaera pacifica TaxID=2818389 RepID=A0ABS3NCF6_9GAMM|nr:hypothetical protein [Oceanisphaera pacifica]MBO1518157.1 hypothetical protein [Oceanisphaera pacifica]